jgi:hypothetical protein
MSETTPAPHDTTEPRRANEVRDGGWVDGEWKPRPRPTVIGEIEWLARMSDKARAKARGTIGAYIYPCPLDQRLLAALAIDAETFQRLAVEAESDEQLVGSVRRASPSLKDGTFQFALRRRD